MPITVLPNVETRIPIKFKKFVGRDVEFVPEFSKNNGFLRQKGDFLRGMINGGTKDIIFRSTSATAFRLPANLAVGYLRDLDVDVRAYYVSSDDPRAPTFNLLAADSELAACEETLLEATLSPTDAVPSPGALGSTSNPMFQVETLSADDVARIEKALSTLTVSEDYKNDPKPYGVTINHKDAISPYQTEVLSKVVRAFPELWTCKDTVMTEPESDYLRIPLTDDSKSAKTRGPYRLSSKDKKVVDDTFQKLHEAGKMSWGPPGTLAWPCFVVWTGAGHGGSSKPEKGRVVIDIRGLNAMVPQDTYPLPHCEDVIQSVRDCNWLSTFDLTSSFYQRLVHPSDRWKLGVISHRGVEVLHVAPMGFKNSPAHMQRLLDAKFRGISYVKAYIDDILAHSSTFADHIEHLIHVLGILKECGLDVSAKKSYIGFHSARSLGHMVDKFGLSTLEDKRQAMASIQYPRTLGDLETAIGMFGYYRRFIPKYSQLISPLQKLKTALLKAAPKSGRERKEYSSKKRLPDATPAQLYAFNTLKQQLGSPQTLRHFDNTKDLIIYVDSSKDHGFAAAVHQEHQGIEHPICYLSKELNAAERNYWPTELEVAGAVWVCMKLKHWIDDAPAVKLVTDHSAAVNIFRQLSLKTSSPAKSNLRLTRASIYMSQFANKMDFIYKPGIQHRNADALSRLKRLSPDEPYLNKRSVQQDQEVFDNIKGFHAPHWLPMATNLIVTMARDLHELVSRSYDADVTFGRVWKSLNALAAATPNRVSGSLEPVPKFVSNGIFCLKSDPVGALIFLRDQDTSALRLCVPKAAHARFLCLYHDCKGHGGLEKTCALLRQSCYMRNMRSVVADYITGCPQCQKNKPRRFKPYGELKPLNNPPAPFHTICMDFIVKLPLSTAQGYDMLLTITDKLTKAVILVPGKSDYKAVDWASAWWAKVYPAWGLPSIIISDRDPIFTSEMWRDIFGRLRTELALTTAYNPRANGQAENTNQRVEILLRHLVDSRQSNWAACIPEVQMQFNNMPSVSTGGYSPNQLCYGVNLRDVADATAPNPVAFLEHGEGKIFAEQMATIRADARDALQHAAMIQAEYFDKRHQPLPEWNVGDKVRICYAQKLEKGYSHPTLPKLGPKFSEPLTIKNKISKYAYELDLPAGSQIHPVISITNLAPAKESENFTRVEVPQPVITADPAMYEVQDIFDRKTVRGQTLYKVKYVGIDKPEWEKAQDLGHIQDAIDTFNRIKDHEAIILAQRKATKTGDGPSAAADALRNVANSANP